MQSESQPKGIEVRGDGSILMRNGGQTALFVKTGDGYRPEWMRSGERAMLRFKDHEWLNIGQMRVTNGELLELTASACLFGGTVQFAHTPVAWTVRVSLPEDGSGFLVTTKMMPKDEPIEVLEALSALSCPMSMTAGKSPCLSSPSSRSIAMRRAKS